MYRRFAKAFYLISVFFFLFVFLYFYSALPEKVAYELNENGYPTAQVSKDTFFYTGVVLFLVFNVLLVFPAKLVEKQALGNLRRLFLVGDPFREHMLAWIYSFGAVLNLSLSIVVFYFHNFNNQYEIEASAYSFFYYLAPVLLIVWVIFLFIIIGRKFKTIQSPYKDQT